MGEDGTIGKAYGYQLGVKHQYKEGMFDQVDRVLYDLKNNPYASDSEEFEMRLMNLCIRHGTGTKASYELCPVWRVQTAGKGDIDFCLAVYDAVSGKRLFEGLL